MSTDFKVPCIKVCAVERNTGWCFGCGRTGPEITGWFNMTAVARESVLADLPRRLAAIGLSGGPDRERGRELAREQRLATGRAIAAASSG